MYDIRNVVSCSRDEIMACSRPKWRCNMFEEGLEEFVACFAGSVNLCLCFAIACLPWSFPSCMVVLCGQWCDFSIGTFRSREDRRRNVSV